MTTNDNWAFDCDTHIYEPRDAMTRYLPEKFLDRTIRPIPNANGKDVVLAGSRIATFNSEEGIGFDYAYRPGSLRQLLKEMSSGDPNAKYQAEPMRPAFVEREPRLALLDEQEVSRCVVFPGALALSAEHYVADTEALYANLSSYNRWYDEAWGFNYQDRIYATALLSLRDLDRAVALTDEILDARRPGGPPPDRAGRTVAAPATRTSTRCGAGSTRPAWSSPCTSCRTGTSRRSPRPGATTPTRRRGACRHGSG